MSELELEPLEQEALRVLRAAHELVRRDHTPRALAVDRHGRKADPLSSSAVAWSTVGALIKVAPSGTRPPRGPAHTYPAWLAYLALADAAESLGYPSTYQVDQAGAYEVERMFVRAKNRPLMRRPRRTRGQGQGSQPRGEGGS